MAIVPGTWKLAFFKIVDSDFFFLLGENSGVQLVKVMLLRRMELRTRHTPFYYTFCALWWHLWPPDCCSGHRVRCGHCLVLVLPFLQAEMPIFPAHEHTDSPFREVWPQDVSFYFFVNFEHRSRGGCRAWGLQRNSQLEENLDDKLCLEVAILFFKK